MMIRLTQSVFLFFFELFPFLGISFILFVVGISFILFVVGIEVKVGGIVFFNLGFNVGFVKAGDTVGALVTLQVVALGGVPRSYIKDNAA